MCPSSQFGENKKRLPSTFHNDPGDHHLVLFCGIYCCNNFFLRGVHETSSRLYINASEPPGHLLLSVVIVVFARTRIWHSNRWFGKNAVLRSRVASTFTDVYKYRLVLSSGCSNWEGSTKHNVGYNLQNLYFFGVPFLVRCCHCRWCCSFSQSGHESDPVDQCKLYIGATLSSLPKQTRQTKTMLRN